LDYAFNAKFLEWWQRFLRHRTWSTFLNVRNVR
jgi:hypothetical protein